MNIRTDLALEAAEIYEKQGKKDFDGIEITRSEAEGFEVIEMYVKTEDGAKKIGKEKGRYITIEMPRDFHHNPENDKELIQILKNCLTNLMGETKGKTVLVAGLGNRGITADCIGPAVVDGLLVTRHIFSHMPPQYSEKMKSVCAVSPGVLGITGIETGEILAGVCERVKPDLVIAVDALAAKSLERVNKTVQLCDSGISPGAGVGNSRKALNRDLLGAEVYVIGVPTVVDAYTLICDAIGEENCKNITPRVENMIVTPKDIDAQAKRLSAVIAKAINCALQEELDESEISYLVDY